MKYKKVTVTLRPNDEVARVLMQDAMGERGFESFLDTEIGFEGYIQEGFYSEDCMVGLRPEIEGVEMTYEVEDVRDEDWNEAWEKTNFTPIEIDGRCVIRSTEHEERRDVEYEILINPEMAFGTGHHETTRMITHWLLTHNMTGERVLDMGCGTGVLGILAAKRGAERVLGVDIDEWSVRNTEKNIGLNGIEGMCVKEGGAEVLSDYRNEFSIVIANINRNILTRDMAQYVASLRRGGRMVLSGFYTADAKIIEAAAQEYGLRLTETAEDDDWQMMCFEK